MKYLSTYGDQRQLAYCAFCGGSTGTRDHCPSKIFLDTPYPENLPVVPACSPCNQSFSADEEYLACFISCVIAGSTKPDDISREKIAGILADKPALRARIEQSRTSSPSGTLFNPEMRRITAVMKKLSQGHALYELHEPCPRPPTEILIRPLSIMNDSDRLEFESPTSTSLSACPEVGSRALQRLVLEDGEIKIGWLEVQPERYRFRASIADGIEIRIVIHEYLSAVLHWD